MKPLIPCTKLLLLIIVHYRYDSYLIITTTFDDNEPCAFSNIRVSKFSGHGKFSGPKYAFIV